MEQYIVITLIDSTNKKDEKFRIIRADQQIPPEYKRVHGPSTLDDCTKWLSDSLEVAGNWFWISVAQYGLIFLVTLVFVSVIVFGTFQLYKADATSGATLEDTARIFITFVVAVGTIAIALLAILTAMIIREYKERFALAKEVLTVLVGILGTIIGFYFGSARQAPAGNTNTNVNGNTTPNTNTKTNGNGNSGNSSNRNANTEKNTNTNTNTNTAGITVRPSRDLAGQRTSLIQNDRGKWKVVVAKL